MYSDYYIHPLEFTQMLAKEAFDKLTAVMIQLANKLRKELKSMSSVIHHHRLKMARRIEGLA